MSWLDHHRRVWRVAILMTLPVAMMGPWTFDRVHVPSQYACSAPHIRLDENFCGILLPGTWFLSWPALWFLSASDRLAMGPTGLADGARDFFIALLPSLLVLPFFSTLLLILRGDCRRRQVLNVVAWVLAVLAGGAGLLIGVPGGTGRVWVLWGIWLYVTLAVTTLALEVLALRR